MVNKKQNIPDGWEVKKLGDICKIFSGFGFKKNEYSSDGFNLIQIENVKHDYIDTNGCFCILIEYKKQYKNYILNEGDIVIALNRPITQNKLKIGIIKKSNLPAILYQRVGRCDIADSCNKLFSFYILKKYIFSYVLRKSIGSDQPFISTVEINKQKLLLPPLSEQERIAGVLGCFDEGIEKLGKIISLKEKQKKGLMQKLLTPPSPLAGDCLNSSPSPLAGEGWGEGLNPKGDILYSPPSQSHREYLPYIKDFSRSLRKEATKEENILWNKLRNNQLGYKFRRQHQIDNKYIADFVCLEKRIIIELDGGQHSESYLDKERTSYLENEDFRVVRFWNNDVNDNLEGCLKVIMDELLNPSPLPSPARGEGAKSLRLKGFSQPWKEVKLGDVSEIKKGEQLNVLNMQNNGLYPALNGGISPSGRTNNWNVDANTIIISEGGNSCGFVNFIKEKFWSGGHCYNLTKLKTEESFLYQVLKNNEKNIMKLRVGSGLPNIQKSSIEKFTLNIPTNISEQSAIADVLTSSDREIELLKQKLGLFKQQKKYLMQQLLTGQKRLKIN